MRILVLLASVTALSLGTPTFSGQAEDAINLINKYRQKAGRKALAIDPELQDSAQKHADELVQRGYGTKLTSGHKGKNGSTPLKRAKRSGYKACVIVENLAWGQKTASIVVTEWMGSKKHKENIMNRKAREVGIGFAAPKTWVFVAAKPC